MSSEPALLWLKQHDNALPALAQSLNALQEEDHQPVQTSLSDVVSADPALALALLKKVNTNRSASSGKDIVSSAQSAIALLGERISRKLFQEIPQAQQQLLQPQQFFLYSQIINRSLQCLHQMDHWAKQCGYQQTDEFRLPALLYFCAEALCCCFDFTHYLEFIKAGRLANAEVDHFGFSFKQFSVTLCQQFNLPLLLEQAQNLETSKRQQAQLMFHIATLCEASERGWFQPEMQQYFEALAVFLQLPLDTVITQFHQNSVEFSRQSTLTDAWQPASRLVLISDTAWRPAESAAPQESAPAQPKPAATAPATAAEGARPTAQPEISGTENQPQQDNICRAISRSKKLLGQSAITQSQILQACIEGLAYDLEFSRVALFLLSRDKATLQIRMALGIEKASPLRQLQLKTQQAGLFKILLNKPQAIRLHPQNFEKYASLIPPRLLATSQTRDFVAMSLFINDKPVAVIYADQQGKSASISQAEFNHFKQTVSFCSKALAFLQKKSA